MSKFAGRGVVWWLGAVFGALLVSMAGGGAACRFALNCHVRTGNESSVLNRGSGETRLPPGFAQDVVARVQGYPTDFAFMPDGRLLVADRSGLVHVFDNGRVHPKPFLDLRSRVDTQFFRGLVNVAVDPGFGRNHFVYAVYASSSGVSGAGRPTVVHVSRFTADGDTASLSTERVILGAAGQGSCTLLPAGRDCVPSDVDHVGADIEFGSDGTLFISTGDGGGTDKVEPSALRAQNIDGLGGKILHVDRDGRGLPGNPFWNGDPNANRSKLWASGFRNPFRITLGPNGLVYVGDVGWDMWEEIDVAKRGGNYGWPCYEGWERQRLYRQTAFCRRAYGHIVALAPLVAMNRVDAQSTSGGVVYTGTQFPERYRGVLFIADWGRSWIRLVHLTGGGRQLQGRVLDFATNTAGPVRLRVRDGALYYVAANVGEVRRISYAPR